MNQSSKFAKLKDVIILDTGSTIKATFMNSDFLTKIQPAKHPLIMSTNAGMKKLNIVGTIQGFGRAYYDPNQIANIFGFSHLVDKCRITYNLDIEDAFIVHHPNGPIKFS